MIVMATSSAKLIFAVYFIFVCSRSILSVSIPGLRMS